MNLKRTLAACLSATLLLGLLPARNTLRASN